MPEVIHFARSASFINLRWLQDSEEAGYRDGSALVRTGRMMLSRLTKVLVQEDDTGSQEESHHGPVPAP